MLTSNDLGHKQKNRKDKIRKEQFREDRGLGLDLEIKLVNVGQESNVSQDLEERKNIGLLLAIEHCMLGEMESWQQEMNMDS